MIRILGIDPGSRVTGYGIIDQSGQKICYVASGCIRTRGGALADRLGIIFAGVREIIEEYTPNEMAIEVNMGSDESWRINRNLAVNPLPF